MREKCLQTPGAVFDEGTCFCTFPDPGKCKKEKETCGKWGWNCKEDTCKCQAPDDHKCKDWDKASKCFEQGAKCSMSAVLSPLDYGSPSYTGADGQTTSANATTMNLSTAMTSARTKRKSAENMGGAATMDASARLRRETSVAIGKRRALVMIKEVK